MTAQGVTQDVTIQAAKHRLSGRWQPVNSVARKRPLIVALHGGSFTSRYFDLPGHSFLESAYAQGFPSLAIDRPCYGKSDLAPTATTFALNAEILSEAIQNFWQSHGREFAGVVLVGHSIGGAIALMIAALPQRWPLLGVAVSGIGLVCPSHIAEAWKSLPDIPLISLPPDIKRQVMFGPENSYDVEARELCMSDDCPVPRPELMEIVFGWPKNVAAVAAKISVPVHYRHAQFEGLWESNQKTISDVQAALSSAPAVDAAIFKNTGHCIDFHHVGPALHMQQLAFAIECVEAKTAQAA